MTVRMAAATVIIAVIAAIIAIVVTAIIGVAFITHVIAQRTACTAARGCTDQCAGAAADTATQNVAACGPERAANGSLATAAFVSTYGAAGCAADACANRRARRAAELLSNYGAKNSA